MSQHDHLLKQLCGSSSETLARARELLYIATVRTAPGTGFQLKDPLGRPAACALIASEQLKNTVVDPASAQGNSCLNPTAFQKCLAQVRAALAHTASHQPSDPTKRRQTRSEFISQISYDSLVAKYALLQTYGDRFVSWCQRAEFAFFDLGKGNNIARDSPKIKLGIFFWVCGILEPDRLDLASFVKNNGAHTDNTAGITKIMDVHGSKIRALILAESKRPKETVATRSSTRVSPGKRPMREAPSKDSPKKRKLSAEDDTVGTTAGKQFSVPNHASGPPKALFPPSTSPRKSPSKQVLRELPTKSTTKKTRFTVVGQEDSDVEMSLPDTPSKRRLLGTSSDQVSMISPSRPRAPSPSPTRRSIRLNSAIESPSQTVVNIKDLYIDNPPERANMFATTVRRRFRPVFLDRKQWSAPDPLLVKLQNRINKVTVSR
ncbi:hypothetical protein GGU10DRAFT_385407 [Lentinula aff. detonsa]|uniref:Uncharacterized protein n=1 Tax=Lentinula aff. detonsa TaxID=2804958 RepID=A0AA38KHM6_9AGAR|nr:hypothetical protein GGU10DRAFT_385407 [Lentinula aff. detonsa]